MFGSEKYRAFLTHPGFNGGKSGGSQTQTAKSEPWKEVQPYLKEGYARAQDLYAPGNGPAYYPGQTYAPTDPLTNQSRNMTEYYANNGMMGDLGAVRSAYGNTLNPNALLNNPLMGSNALLDNPLMGSNALLNNPLMGDNKLLHAMDQDNPYLDDYVRRAMRPVQEQLTEKLLPSIRSGAVNTGQYGGSRQALAEGTAIGDATDTMGDISARMYSDAYGQGLNAYGQGLNAQQAGYGLYGHGLNAQQAGYGLYGQGLNAVNAGLGRYGEGINAQLRSALSGQDMMNTSMMPASVLGQLGQQYEGDTQKVIDSANQRFGYNQNLPYNMLSDYMNILNGADNYGKQTQTTSQQGGSNGVLGALGTALSLASMFSMGS